MKKEPPKAVGKPTAPHPTPPCSSTPSPADGLIKKSLLATTNITPISAKTGEKSSGKSKNSPHSTPNGKMYLNGNSPYYGGYYPNRFLPFATSSAQTSTGGGLLENTPPPPTPAIPNGRTNGYRTPQNNTNHVMSDTVAVAGDDLSNVPAAVIIQLEKANRTIAAQNVEIDRLKAYQNQNVETQLLRKQITDLEKEMRSSRSRFLEQQELLAEMSREMDNLVREKIQMQTQFQEMEKKYKKAKFASRELAKILENDICGTTTTSKTFVSGFESDDEKETVMHNHSLFNRSRTMSRQQEGQELKAKAERQIEQSESWKQREEIKQSRLLAEKLIDENEELLIQLDRERRMTESLQDDLEKSRRLVIDRDEKIEELRGKLGKAETKATQCESDLSRTSTDLALERARCDALTLELHEFDAIFQQTQSTVQAFAAENETLEENCRSANKQILTLNAKLEAQGIDLVTTKRTLRALREATEKRSGPY
uniref:Uncharacterized protein n=1 Tax=Caenorhabditis japonica TaxID=281687 RepID=A0A8R1I3C1_CAEJA